MKIKILKLKSKITKQENKLEIVSVQTANTHLISEMIKKAKKMSRARVPLNIPQMVRKVCSVYLPVYALQYTKEKM
jgi:hypothetical protein